MLGAEISSGVTATSEGRFTAPPDPRVDAVYLGLGAQEGVGRIVQSVLSSAADACRAKTSPAPK